MKYFWVNILDTFISFYFQLLIAGTIKNESKHVGSLHVVISAVQHQVVRMFTVSLVGLQYRACKRLFCVNEYMQHRVSEATIKHSAERHVKVQHGLIFNVSTFRKCTFHD